MLPIQAGIVPVSMFPVRSSACSSESAANSGGIFPWRSLPIILKIWRLLSSPSWGGMPPQKSMFDSCSDWSLARLPSSGGMVPVSLSPRLFRGNPTIRSFCSSVRLPSSGANTR